jgi:hypothetical protein
VSLSKPLQFLFGGNRRGLGAPTENLLKGNQESYSRVTQGKKEEMGRGGFRRQRKKHGKLSRLHKLL